MCIGMKKLYQTCWHCGVKYCYTVSYRCWWCVSVYKLLPFSVLARFVSSMLDVYIVYRFFRITSAQGLYHTFSTDILLQTTLSLVLLACVLACCKGQTISKYSRVSIQYYLRSFLCFVLLNCDSVFYFNLYNVFLIVFRNNHICLKQYFIWLCIIKKTALFNLRG